MRRCGLILGLLLVLSGCTEQALPLSEPVGPAPWSVDLAELIEWHAADPVFDQDRAVEASGLTASERYLYTVSEKYGTLLRIDLDQDFKVDPVAIDVPGGAELEGLSLCGRTLYLCDEAHAAVYALDLPDDDVLPERLPVRRLTFKGLEVEGGKTGLEGIAVSADGERLYLLHERLKNGSSCRAEIFVLDVQGNELGVAGDSLVMPLEDCNWRMSGLTIHDGRLLAIKSRYPGERYEIIEIDSESGEQKVVMEITPFGQSLRELGWGNNLEGITVGPNGDLFLVGDNADVTAASSAEPPFADEKSVLIRLPRVR